ncbi:MAG: amidohydrolase [Ignavibacteriales bacterium]
MTKTGLFKWLDGQEGMLREVALEIWRNPETGFQEKHASHLQADVLRKAGFRVQHGLKDMPTVVIAEYGAGRPIVGIAGEYDALPQLSQEVCATRKPVVENAPGHGCGHNLLGTAGVGAALAIKQAMDEGRLKGTIRYYGCPAEETLAGKVFMAREGVFDDLDACLSWHPASMNTVWGCSFLAMNSVAFKFSGVAAHAAAAPELGRSALDGVELMNVGANYMREHINEKARVHYSITNGGGAPNIVPAEASVWYYMRAPKRSQVDDIYSWLQDIARGAALMTSTKVQWDFLAGCYDVLANATLGEVLLRNMREAGGPRFRDEDAALADALAGTFAPGQKEKVMKTYFAPEEVVKLTLHDGVVKVNDESEVMAGSTDVGDVSWIVPFAQFTAATWPVGTPAHSWQATASSGSGIGLAAMHFAAKSLAGAVFDLLSDEGATLAKAKEEFERKSAGQRYKSPLPEGAKPPGNN